MQVLQAVSGAAAVTLPGL